MAHLAATGVETARSRADVRPAVHLWIYNHPFYGISDQIDFFVSSCRAAGYRITVGRQPREDALNVVIENFSNYTRSILGDFCKSTRKRVAVIMTEHMDFANDTLSFHGERLWTLNDYMHPVLQMTRLASLCESLPFIRYVFTLGDMPELENFSKFMPGVPLLRIPFPPVDRPELRRHGPTDDAQYDLVFTGNTTNFRKVMVDEIKAAGLSFVNPAGLISRNRRDFLNRQSKIVLNFPQRPTWRWISLMRVYAALRCGRAALSLGTNDTTEIASCCLQIPTDRPGWIPELTRQIERWQDLYRDSVAQYGAMVRSYEQKHPFPHEFLELWRITDGLKRD